MGRFSVSPAKLPPLCISGFRPPSPVTCSFPAPYNPLLPLAGGLAQVLPILHPYGVIFGFTCQTAPLMHLRLQAPQTLWTTCSSPTPYNPLLPSGQGFPKVLPILSPSGLMFIFLHFPLYGCPRSL